MQAVSAAEFSAHAERRMPDFERVRGGYLTIPFHMPTGVGGPVSFGYLHVDARGRGHLIDAGWDSEVNWQRLHKGLGLAGIPLHDLATVVCTHMHPDHLGMAERIRAHSRARIVLLRDEQEALDRLIEGIGARAGTLAASLERWGAPPPSRPGLMASIEQQHPPIVVRADELLVDGEPLVFGDRTLRVLHTPGHTPGHLCLADEDNRLLFTGDHILPTIQPGLGVGAPSRGNPVDEYFGSLPGLARFDRYEICPGHGYRFTGLSSRMDAIARRHRERAGEALAARANGAQSVWDVASRMSWAVGWDGLEGMYKVSALTQTELYLTSTTFGGLSRDGDVIGDMCI